MAFHYSKRRLRQQAEEDSTELNIIPYLDILMNLIMFMLLSITGLATFGVLNVTAPNYGASTTVSDQSDKPKLLLTVLISKKGFFVAATGAVLSGPSGQGNNTTGAPTLPIHPDGTYDYAALSNQMLAIKKEFPNERQVIVGAESDIPYDQLVQTMDSIREMPAKEGGKHGQELFPDVTLAAM